mmetsp:Transcript_29101/g.38764  ORF Transcript_29101/g.38764 Transcript_29101/m.38764 type:complete len:177 (+) Transcript_29101:1560-2090(+)
MAAQRASNNEAMAAEVTESDGAESEEESDSLASLFGNRGGGSGQFVMIRGGNGQVYRVPAALLRQIMRGEDEEEEESKDAEEEKKDEDEEQKDAEVDEEDEDQDGMDKDAEGEGENDDDDWDMNDLLDDNKEVEKAEDKEAKQAAGETGAYKPSINDDSDDAAEEAAAEDQPMADE